MTQEEKQLLLKDICTRLPYGVMIQRDNGFAGKVTEKLNAHGLSDETYGTFESLNYKPYLRPMSSMTEEERREYDKLIAKCIYDPEAYFFDNYDKLYDWLNEHHFDYRGLIEKSLAIVAPEDLYKYEND